MTVKESSNVEESPMYNEVRSAVQFLTKLVKQRCEGMANSSAFKGMPSAQSMENLEKALMRVLVEHYADHWFPGQPWRGGAYRCIRINGNMDPLISKAGVRAGLDATKLRASFPPELTIWIDPGNVSYRIGEEGSVCELYSGNHSGDESGEEGAHPSSTLHPAASAPSLRSHPSPAPTPPGRGSQRSSPLHFSSSPPMGNTASSGRSFGYGPVHGGSAPQSGGSQGATSLAESLASLMMISATTTVNTFTHHSTGPYDVMARGFETSGRMQQQARASPPHQEPMSTYHLGGDSKEVGWRMGGSPLGTWYGQGHQNHHHRGTPNVTSAPNLMPVYSYLPNVANMCPAGSISGSPPLSQQSSHSVMSTIQHQNKEQCHKDNFERLVECMAPVIASMGSA